MSPHLTYILASLVFTALITGGLRYSAGLSFLVAYGVAINVTALLLCGYDKSISSDKEKIRVPENMLLIIALIGGSAGILVGMMKFRHKTSKPSFQLLLAVVLFVQVALVRYLRNLL